MNPYPERLEELHIWLGARYNQYDRQATEVLLAALLPPELTRTRRPWIIIETDYPSRDCSDAWFSFGGEAVVHSLSVPRVLRCAPSEEIVRNWVELRSTDAAGLFVESEWRRIMKIGRGAMSTFRGNYQHLMSVCLRLRVAHPKGDYAVRVDRDADRLELGRLVRRVLDSSLRPARKPSETARDRPPASFLYWCELLQRVAPYLTDWEMLTGGLAAVARGIAILYSDGRPPDWAAVDRIMRDCINPCTYQIMSQAADHKRANRVADFWSKDDEIRNVKNEIKRLYREGVLVMTRHYRPHGLAASEWRELIDRSKPILT